VYDECDDCHTYPDDIYLDADGVKLSVTVSAQGPFLDEDAIRQYFAERYEEDGAELTEPGAALSLVTYVLRIGEVSDDLVPAPSGTLLFQGACEIEFVHEGQEILRTTLRSKVISGRDREEIHRTILEYLQKKAYEEVADALDRVLYG